MFRYGKTAIAVLGAALALTPAQAETGNPNLKSIDAIAFGPNATLIADDLEKTIRKLKSELEGEIDVAGPALARSLTELGLIDEYRIYLHPVVLGKGSPYFAGPRPPLRLKSMERMDGDVLQLVYVTV